ncbi:MAG: hypothetical protein ACXQT3_00340 [Methermicoccaceae archaeon]
MDVLNRIAMMSGGPIGIAYMLGVGAVATDADTAATTATATEAAVSGKSHRVLGFDVSVRDDDIAADNYIKVELIEDVGGTPSTIATYNFSWDIDQAGQNHNVHIYYPLPTPITCTEGKSISCRVTVAANADLIAANLYTMTW